MREDEMADDDAVETLRRWEDSGGVWRVIARRAGLVTVSLLRCTGDEEQARVISDDPALLAFLAGREASDA